MFCSELAFKTNSNPKFTVTIKPKYGRLVKLNFNEPNLNVKTALLVSNKELMEFTQEDILTNRISYVANNQLDLTYPNEMLIDIIHYRLSAPEVQDAKGILVVNILENKTQTEKTLNPDVNRFKLLSLELTSETLLLTFGAMIALILIICLVLLLRLCPFKRAKQSQPSGGTSDSMKTLAHTATTNMECSSRDYSNSSLRHTDCSTKSSSNSMDNVNGERKEQYPVYKPPSMISSKYSSDVPDSYSSTLAKHTNRHDDVLPLPPPLLYFINDDQGNLFHNQIEWNKSDADQTKIENDFEDNYASRHSNNGPANKLATLERYLYKNRSLLQDEPTPRSSSTLNGQHRHNSANFLTDSTQTKSKYWI